MIAYADDQQPVEQPQQRDSQRSEVAVQGGAASN